MESVAAGARWGDGREGVPSWSSPHRPAARGHIRRAQWRGRLQNICPGLLGAVQVMENKGQPCNCHARRWPRGRPNCGVPSLILEENKTLAEDGRPSACLVNRVCAGASFPLWSALRTRLTRGAAGERDPCAARQLFSWSKAVREWTVKASQNKHKQPEKIRSDSCCS